jgi:predicted PurR-regulated permease PerM
VQSAGATASADRPLQLFVLVLVVALLYVLAPLTPAISVGGLIAVAGYRWFDHLVVSLRGRRALASWIATATVVAAVFIPLSLLAYLTVGEAAAGIGWIVAEVRQLGGLRGATRYLPGALQRVLPALQQRGVEELASLGETAAAAAPRLLGAVGEFVAQSFLAIVTMFYSFRQGPAMVDFLRRVSPLRPDHTQTLLEECDAVARGLLWGNLVTGLVHGAVGAIGYAIVGLPEVFFLGALTVVASFIPAVGTAIIWGPIALVLWLTGAHWNALVLLLWGALVIGTIDNVLRPLLSRGRAQLPNLLLFLTLFGGVMVFGLKGLLLGPLVGALALAGLRLIAAPDPAAPQPAH